jgi:hypothetical protein
MPDGFSIPDLSFLLGRGGLQGGQRGMGGTTDFSQLIGSPVEGANVGLSRPNLSISDILFSSNPYATAGAGALKFLGGLGESEQQKRMNDFYRQQANNLRLGRERSGRLFEENLPRYSRYMNQLENMPSISQQLGGFQQAQNWNPSNTMWRK